MAKSKNGKYSISFSYTAIVNIEVDALTELEAIYKAEHKLENDEEFRNKEILRNIRKSEDVWVEEI